MGLALCHSLPRDVVVQISLLLYFVAFILQAAAIGLHSRDDGAGYFTVYGTSSSRSNALVLLAAHPATYIPTTSALHSGASTTSEKLCNPSGDSLTYACARFAESFHIVNGLTLTSFITGFVVLVLGVFLLVRISQSTLGLLFRLNYAACVPMVLQCGAVGCFFARTVPHARRDTARAMPAGTGGLRFHRRPAANLMIAATALLCAGFVMLFARWVSVIYLRASFEDKKEHSKKEVKELTEAHMVNDDWTRQKQILLSHARSVQVEMAVKNPHKGDRTSAAATTRNSEPFAPRPVETKMDAHRGAGRSVDDSDADTLHFRAASSLTPLVGHGSPSRSGATGAATFDDAKPARAGRDDAPSPPPTAAAADLHSGGNELETSPEDAHPFSEAEVRDTRDGDTATSAR